MVMLNWARVQWKHAALKEEFFRERSLLWNGQIDYSEAHYGYECWLRKQIFPNCFE